MPDDALSRVPPHDEEAERALLGDVFMNPGPSLRAAARVGFAAGDFYVLAHRGAYNAIRAVYERDGGVDAATFYAHLRQNDAETLRTLGPDWVADVIANATGTLADAHAREVRALATKRDVAVAAEELARAARNGTDADALARMFRERAERLEKRSAAGSAWEWVESDALLDEPDEPISWLVKDLVAREHVTLLNGTSKAGKTTMLLGAAFGPLSRGEDAPLGPTPGNRHRPLVIAWMSEESRRQVKRKAKRFGLKGAVILPVT
jgi:hypothetical protein